MGLSIEAVVKLAVSYFRGGFVPVPVKRDKKPGVLWESLQYKEGRPKTEDEVRKTFRSVREVAGVLGLTGETCGLIAFDADNEEDWKKLDALFPDAALKTKSKRGGHVFFAIPEGHDPRSFRNAAHAIFHHPSGVDVEIDIRGQGGYPILPGSEHKSGFIYQAIGTRPLPWDARDRTGIPVLDPTWKLTKQGFTKEGWKPRKTLSFAEHARDFLQRRSPQAEPDSEETDIREKKDPARKIESGKQHSATSQASARLRARAYLQKMDGAVEGCRGDEHTFVAACTLIRGFNLSDEEAFPIFSEWNQRCIPPWTEEELRKKLQGARNFGNGEFGSILNKPYVRKTYIPEDPRDPSEINPPDYHPEPPSELYCQQTINDIDSNLPCQCLYYDEQDPEPGPDPDPEGIVDNLLQEEENRQSHQRTHRQFLIGFGVANKNEMGEFRRLARRLLKVGRCGHLSKKKICKDHGIFGRFNRPCDDTLLCPDCAQIEQRIVRKFIEENWPEEVYEVETRVGFEDYPAILKAYQDVKAKVEKATSGSVPRYVEGNDRVLFYWPVEYQILVRSLFPESRLIPRKEAALRASEAWFAACSSFLTFLRTPHRALPDILDWPWFKNSAHHRTGGGQKIKKMLPWTDIEENRKKLNDKWKLEHPGLDRNHCPKVVYKDGKTGYCNNLGCTHLLHRPTGVKLAERMGDFTEKEEYEILDAHPCEMDWIRSNPDFQFSTGP